VRLAIVGSGPAAVGVISALEKQNSGAEVHVFESGDAPPSFPEVPCSAATEFYQDIYRQLARQSTTIPPEKTLFGSRLEKSEADKGKSIIVSQFRGGLSNFWGGLAQPLDEEDFEDWPLSAGDMQPHYRAIASLIDLAGEHELATRGPIKQLAGFARLQRHINSHPGCATAHVPLLAVRNDRGAQSCCYCGECMAGCFRDAVYRADHSLDGLGKSLTMNIRQDKVLSYRNQVNGVVLSLANSVSEIFDRVYLCAGVLGTAEIVMRSRDVQPNPRMQDNAIFQFPVLNLSSASDNAKDAYFGLSNLLIDIKDQADPTHSVKIQCYPNSDYLWRAMLPAWSWWLAKWPVSWSRDRLIWARLYLHGNVSPHFSVGWGENKLDLIQQSEANMNVLHKSLTTFKKTLKGSSYIVPPVKPVLATTSAHLAGTFPYASSTYANTLAANSELDENVFVCDASCFPSSPTASPTLTIMANARRVALLSLSAELAENEGKH
jgi:choline dehydrogenase-like flavoprotein